MLSFDRKHRMSSPHFTFVPGASAVFHVWDIARPVPGYFCGCKGARYSICKEWAEVALVEPFANCICVDCLHALSIEGANETDEFSGRSPSTA